MDATDNSSDSSDETLGSPDWASGTDDLEVPSPTAVAKYLDEVNRALTFELTGQLPHGSVSYFKAAEMYALTAESPLFSYPEPYSTTYRMRSEAERDAPQTAQPEVTTVSTESTTNSAPRSQQRQETSSHVLQAGSPSAVPPMPIPMPMQDVQQRYMQLLQQMLLQQQVVSQQLICHQIISQQLMVQQHQLHLSSSFTWETHNSGEIVHAYSRLAGHSFSQIREGRPSIVTNVAVYETVLQQRQQQQLQQHFQQRQHQQQQQQQPQQHQHLGFPCCGGTCLVKQPQSPKK